MDELNYEEIKKIEILPVIPLRGLVVFPGMSATLDIERPFSVAAVNQAIGKEQELICITCSDPMIENPRPEDFYKIGTICTVKQTLKLPGLPYMRVLIEGKSRANVKAVHEGSPYIAEFYRYETPAVPKLTNRTEALIRRCLGLLEENLELADNKLPNLFFDFGKSDDPGFVADFCINSVALRFEDKQTVLEELNPIKRLNIAIKLLDKENDIVSLEKSLEETTKEELSRTQREYFLREQMKVIREELGECNPDCGDDVDETTSYSQKIKALKLPKEDEEKLLKDVSRLSKQPFGSSEGSVLRTYLDICLEVPWNEKAASSCDIIHTKKILDEDHYGLEKVKERVLEYLAVRQLAPELTSPVLCLVGPPGVGKTSIAMSIARATNRKLSRVSLGGVHDEAEIRGHRKTYIGSMPGRIVNGLIQAKSMNPVMVLDEIDKLAGDYKGDPASALLEVLDGEQNKRFRDNFLEIPIDISDVFFITTANTTSTIPPALLDRMELIELSSYTDEEKLQIAKNHLVPKQRKKHGLKASQLKFTDDALREIITNYTRESGVRNLERELASCCRKTAKFIAEGTKKSVYVKEGKVSDLLGIPKFMRDELSKKNEVGLVHGLAWTSAGGEMLDAEVVVLEGNGKLELTGNLGTVMQESAKTAVSLMRSRAAKLGIAPDFYKTKDIHIHFPEGAVPKDGPSAGVTVTTALASALSGKPVRYDVAMTGEISLRGKVMPIGGLREKTMAALRAGIHTVIIPADNVKDLEEIDPLVKAQLNFIPVSTAEEVLKNALVF